MGFGEVPQSITLFQAGMELTQRLSLKTFMRFLFIFIDPLEINQIQKLLQKCLGSKMEEFYFTQYNQRYGLNILKRVVKKA